MLDASFVIALLRREPGASALAHVLPRGVMTSVTAGEVFAAIVEAGGPDTERVEGVLRALGVTIVGFPQATARHLPGLRRLNSARRAEEREVGEMDTALSLADLCLLAYATAVDLPMLTGHQSWSTVAGFGRTPVTVVY